MSYKKYIFCGCEQSACHDNDRHRPFVCPNTASIQIKLGNTVTNYCSTCAVELKVKSGEFKPTVTKKRTKLIPL